MRRPAALAVTLVSAAAVTACGGERQPRAPAGAVPEVLRGTWETRSSQVDIARPPGGSARQLSIWTLKFLGTGGDDNGPSVFLSNDQIGELVAPIAVSENEITLKSRAPCSKFRFRVKGSILTFHPRADFSGCRSNTIGSVLVGRGWAHGSGTAGRANGGRSNASAARTRWKRRR